MVATNQALRKGAVTARIKRSIFRGIGFARLIRRSCCAAQRIVGWDTSRTKAHTSIFRLRKGNMAALEFFRAIKTACASLSVVFVVGLLSAFWCAAGAASASMERRGKDVSDVLQQHEGKIVVLRDLDSEVVEHLRTTGGNEATPGTVVADFNGDGIKDIALLTKEPDGTHLALRVFLCKSECRQVSRVALGEFEGLQYLTPIQP